MRRIAKRIVSYFVSGLIIVVPVAFTLWLLGVLIVSIDSWSRQILGKEIGSIFGLGLLLTAAFVTLVGLLGSHFFTRRFVRAFGRVFERLPVVKMVYSAVKDMMNAFVGPERRFDRPVLVEMQPGTGIRALGFITRESMAHLGLNDDLAVYFPQAYNFAGQVLIVRRSAITTLEAPPAQVMTFIVSGGVSGVSPSSPALPGK
jgi:uncharacterized membrane protein